MAAENKVDRLETLRRDALESIEKLVAFAHAKGLIDGYDTAYARNGLIDLIGCDSPFDGEIAPFDIPDTATALLKPITDYACAAGIAEDDNTSRDLFETRAMGMVTPSPAETRMRFEEIYNAQGAKAATDWFYDMCCACNYIQVDRVAKNIRYFADSPVGELEITINLSKPRIPGDRQAEDRALRGLSQVHAVCGEPRLRGPRQLPGAPESPHGAGDAGRRAVVHAVFAL
ncbi:MAG: hypothetical protein ACLTAO_01020 [Christensenellales bacterium]